MRIDAFRIVVVEREPEQRKNTIVIENIIKMVRKVDLKKTICFWLVNYNKVPDMECMSLAIVAGKIFYQTEGTQHYLSNIPLSYYPPKKPDRLYDIALVALEGVSNLFECSSGRIDKNQLRFWLTSACDEYIVNKYNKTKAGKIILLK